MKRSMTINLIKTFTKFATIAFISSLLSLTSNFANAEVIQVPIGQQANDKQNIKRPTTGLKSALVEAEFGAPINKTSPVGTPPISMWVYTDFVVYFEHDHVIHTVLKHTPIATE